MVAMSEAESGAADQLERELSRWAELDEMLADASDLQTVGDLVLSSAMDLVQARAGVVMTTDGGAPTVCSASGDSAGLSTVAQEALAWLRQQDGRGPAFQLYGGGAPGGGSWIVLPIRFQGEVVGIAALSRDQAAPFTSAEAQRASRLLRHAGLAVGSALLHQELAAAKEVNHAFVSTIAHELKTPLAAIRGYSDLMHAGLTGPINDKQRHFLVSINRNVTRTTTYIQNLADLTRLEAGRLKLLAEPVDLLEVVENAVRAVRAEYEEKGTQLHLELPEALPPVLGDDLRLQQVVTALLLNACQYSPPGADVFLTVLPSLPDAVREAAGPLPTGAHIYCAVRDYGYGISSEDQGQLFAKFFRSSAANVRQTPGGGLALALSRAVVALQGGALWCESELGQGSTFHLALPPAE
jgi:signal transduction histidine kinase